MASRVLGKLKYKNRCLQLKSGLENVTVKGHRCGQCSIKQTLSERNKKKYLHFYTWKKSATSNKKACANIHYPVAKKLIGRADHEVDASATKTLVIGHQPKREASETVH